MVVQLPHDHHCAWREHAVELERRLAELADRQQQLFEQQAALLAQVQSRDCGAERACVELEVNDPEGRVLGHREFEAEHASATGWTDFLGCSGLLCTADRTAPPTLRISLGPPRIVYHASVMLRCLLVVGMLSLQGCSFLFVNGPPDGHEELRYFDCPSGEAAPVADASWAVLDGILIAALADTDDSDPSDEPSTSGIAVVGIVGAVHVASMVYGIVNTNACADAKQHLQQRIADRDAESARTIEELQRQLEEQRLRQPSTNPPAPAESGPPAGAGSSPTPDDSSTPAPGSMVPAEDAGTDHDGGTAPAPSQNEKPISQEPGPEG